MITFTITPEVTITPENLDELQKKLKELNVKNIDELQKEIEEAIAMLDNPPRFPEPIGFIILDDATEIDSHLEH
jgi:hypothetical protein